MDRKSLTQINADYTQIYADNFNLRESVCYLRKSALRISNIKNKGSVLITTIIILAFLSVLGMDLIVYLLSRSVKTNLELDRLKAYYLAEAGIAKAIHELKIDKDLDNNGLGNILRASLGGGTYKASHNYVAATITATGEYNNLKRVVQMKYSAL